VVSALGKRNYFKSMQVCDFILGNSSSGIVEAASFNKWVVNVGDRQEGRLRNDNVLDVPFEKQEIINSIQETLERGAFTGVNKYQKSNAVHNIIDILLHERF
jgi:GDP/UDP-N,N'-diacetylbacillosamine 2-epimerase (hydrolysing)